MTVHGEGSVVRYEVSAGFRAGSPQRAQFPIAQMRFERQIRFGGERAIEIRETLENLSAADRPIAWTQHATLGPPFLERGRTEFRASATRSQSVRRRLSASPARIRSAAPISTGRNVPDDRRRPCRPARLQRRAGLRRIHHAPDGPASRARVLRRLFALRSQLAFGYVWKRADFPWLGIWEENYSRTLPPWSGTNAHARHGIRRVAHLRNAPQDDRAQSAVRCAVLSLDSGEDHGAASDYWAIAGAGRTRSRSARLDGRRRRALRVVIRAAPRHRSPISTRSGAFNRRPARPPSGTRPITCCTSAWLRLVDDRLAGFAVARRTAPDEIEILNVAVDPPFRRRGVARGLIRAAARGTIAVRCIWRCANPILPLVSSTIRWDFR